MAERSLLVVEFPLLLKYLESISYPIRLEDFLYVLSMKSTNYL